MSLPSMFRATLPSESILVSTSADEITRCKLDVELTRRVQALAPQLRSTLLAFLHLADALPEIAAELSVEPPGKVILSLITTEGESAGTAA